MIRRKWKDCHLYSLSSLCFQNVVPVHEKDVFTKKVNVYGESLVTNPFLASLKQKQKIEVSFNLTPSPGTTWVYLTLIKNLSTSSTALLVLFSSIFKLVLLNCLFKI